MESNLLSCDPKQNEEILNITNYTQNDLSKLIEIKLKTLLQEVDPVGWNAGKTYKVFSPFEKLACRKKLIKSLRNAQGR